MYKTAYLLIYVFENEHIVKSFTYLLILAHKSDRHIQQTGSQMGGAFSVSIECLSSDVCPNGSPGPANTSLKLGNTDRTHLFLFLTGLFNNFDLCFIEIDVSLIFFG